MSGSRLTDLQNPESIGCKNAGQLSSSGKDIVDPFSVDLDVCFEKTSCIVEPSGRWFIPKAFDPALSHVRRHAGNREPA